MVKKKNIIHSNAIVPKVIMVVIAVILLVFLGLTLRNYMSQKAENQKTLVEVKSSLDIFANHFKKLLGETASVNKSCARLNTKYSQGPIMCSVAMEATKIQEINKLQDSFKEDVPGDYVLTRTVPVEEMGKRFIQISFSSPKTSCTINISTDNESVAGVCGSLKALPDFIPGYTITD